MEFVRLDDWQYVIDNPLVRAPTWSGVARVFSEVRRPSTVDGYFQPLTMTSLMLDGVLSGEGVPSPFVFRLTNVFFHALAAIAVMLIVREAVGGIWIPAIVAALFAAHPVQVESVAWISQRKTVLSGFLALSATWCYLRSRRSNHIGWMAGVTGLFALAAMSKPMAVLIPLTWPLLDRWPLRMKSNWRALTPVLVLMIVSGTIAWSSQAGSGAAVAGPGGRTMAAVIPVVLASLGQYIGNLVWPMTLSPYREIRGLSGFTESIVIFSVIGLALAVAMAWVSRRKTPAAFVASACFLVLLAPALGIVRFDATIVADRFLYLPLAFALLPLAAIAAWAGRASPRHTALASALAAFLLIPSAVLNRAQQGIWHDSLALWSHVADVCPSLAKAQYELAVVKLDLGMPQEALVHAKNALTADRTNSQYAYTLGRALIETGDEIKGVEFVQAAINMGLGPQRPWAHMTLARVFVLGNKVAQARERIEMAQACGDVDAGVYADLADAAWRKADSADFAVELYDMALSRGGPVLIWRWNRGGALEQAGRLREALAAYDDVLSELDRGGFVLPEPFAKARASLARRMAATQATTQATSHAADEGDADAEHRD